MANGAVWGIDIGQCALKALRCRADDDANTVVAEAFDYIEYPKILSQPGAEPAELIGDALKQFLSRNSVLGDRVAVSVSGQAGLSARFIKLPPVEAKKIPDIVRYEARQQIPFDLNDVVWDYQQMGGGSHEEGFALETEVGLFAMKRDVVLRALEPFANVGIDVDIVQLTPLVLYNFVVFDQLRDLPAPDEYDSEDPPESVVIISLGTDATDLVVTNGYRVWQRSIPLGGNHFTRALTKELKLTFARAEHLKRNATAAPDPKAVFQAMRPVFADLLTELQRSIGYFSNLDRTAKIGRVLAMGNAMKLPGLRRYLSQSLGYNIEKIDAFQGLAGPEVTGAPSFHENLLSFGVAYGLALQGLNKGSVHTNLLPKEITFDRMINRKKPWAVGAAALLVLGCSISFAAYALGLSGVDPEVWKAKEAVASQFVTKASGLKTAYEQAKSSRDNIDQVGQRLVKSFDGRLQWLELLKAVNSCLPVEPPVKEGERPKPITERNELHVTSVTCDHHDDVASWYAKVSQYDDANPEAAAALAAAATAPPPAQTEETEESGSEAVPVESEAGPTVGPSGSGWIVTLTGAHYHNDNKDFIDQGAEFVNRRIIAGLRTGKVKLPGLDPKTLDEVSMAELGISYPVLVKPGGIEMTSIPDPDAEPTRMQPAAMPAMVRQPSRGPQMNPRIAQPQPKPQTDPAAAPGTKLVPTFFFDVQFCWQPKSPSQRLADKKAKEAAPQAPKEEEPKEETAQN